MENPGFMEPDLIEPDFIEPDFIEVYEDALEAGVCADLIARFEASGKLTRGATGGGVNTELKDSWDLCISLHDEWKQGEALLNRAMLHGLMKYVRRYAFLAIAPMQLSRQDPATGKLVAVDATTIASMADADLQRLVTQVFRPGKINIQRYFADQGGYPYWHSEIFPKQDADECLHRVLLWTIYLNEGFSEGETEFFHQQRKIAPRTGSLLFAPAGFHAHASRQPAKGGNKYIATSWVLFERADRLYVAPPPMKSDPDLSARPGSCANPRLHMGALIHLPIEEAARRRPYKPILAGRNRDALEILAQR